jgi:phosphotransferase system  glucose/maltose/N-acetylglucosamine-specific IIC component
MQRKWLLIVTALGEAGTGLVLLAVPSVVFQWLLGMNSPAVEAILLGRFAGGALLAIGVACWLARNDDGRPAQMGLVGGVFVYDIAAAALLAYAGLQLSMAGILLWPAVMFHGILSVWCILCLRMRPNYQFTLDKQREASRPEPPPKEPTT